MMTIPPTALVDWHTLLDRARLYDRKPGSSAYPDRAQVLLIAGMMGSGKTVACHQYVHRLGLPTIMVELKPGIVHDWSIFHHAQQQAGLPHGQLPPVMHPAEPMAVVIEQLEQGLDPYGRPSPSVAEWLAVLLGSPLLHVVLVSRVLPVYPPLIQQTAQGRVTVIDGAVLAFTPVEAQALWSERQPIPLTDDQARNLIVRTGGLPSAIALACSLGWPPQMGQNPWYDSLLRDLLSPLPAAVRACLIPSAVLETLTLAHVAAATEQPDSNHVLQLLTQHGLLCPGDPAVLHPLMQQAALLYLRDFPAERAAVIRRLVDLNLTLGAYDQAWQYASAAQLWWLANHVVLQAGDSLRQQGASQMLIDWLLVLPPALRSQDASVLLARCQTDVGDLDGALLTLRQLRTNEPDPNRHREYTIRLALVHQVRGEVMTADQLIQPYLHALDLSSVWQARVFRLHAIALALSGMGEAAWAWITRSVSAAHAGHEPRVLALAYQDQAAIAGRLGRLTDAEQALRLAERCWRDLHSVVDLAVTLNSRAMLALAQRDSKRAYALGQEARIVALQGARKREAAVASATCGDVALAQGNFDEAVTHYQVALEDADASGYFALRGYSLAMQAHLARLQRNVKVAAQLLPRLQQHRIESPEQAGWLATGIVATQLTLGHEPNIKHLQQAFAQLGTDTVDVRVALFIMLAQAWWHLAEAHQARSTWDELERFVLTTVGDAHLRLAPLAGANPALLDAVAGAQPGRFAQLVQAMHSGAPAAGARTAPPSAELVVRVLGAEEQVWTQGHPVPLPKHGLVVLLVLLTSPVPVPEDDVLTSIWHSHAVSVHALRKLVVRIHSVLPGVIKQIDGCYKFAPPAGGIDVDVVNFLKLEVATAPTTALLSWAELASNGCLAHQVVPWAHELRHKVNRRLALIWLEIGRRAMPEQLAVSAHDMFARAQQADPTSDIVTRTILQHALACGDRASVIQHYLHYQQALNVELGLEPAADLAALYRQALEP